jgi:hypothetical protein
MRVTMPATVACVLMVVIVVMSLDGTRAPEEEKMPMRAGVEVAVDTASVPVQDDRVRTTHPETR